MSERDLLMIPGPIELEPAVLEALGRRPLSHVEPAFIEMFQRALDRLKRAAQSVSAQPFIVSGSGTLAMEMAVANLVEPGDSAIVVSTGYFGDRMRTILERHGVTVTLVEAEPGQAPEPEAVRRALSVGNPTLLAVTHVDTSTGVRAPIETYLNDASAQGVLTIVDGVCSMGGEAFDQDGCGADIMLTASQKALGAPAGLALLTASSRAIDAWKRRRSPVRSFYGDFGEWLPIMEAYAAGRPSYFGTPPVNLICALDVALGRLLEEGLSARFERHARTARAFRAAWRALGIEPVPASEALAANTLSALHLPEGVGPELAKRVAARGVKIAGGLHPALKTSTFRVGHMGSVRPSDVFATVAAVGGALAELGKPVSTGEALAEAERVLRE